MTADASVGIAPLWRDISEVEELEDLLLAALHVKSGVVMSTRRTT
jgi:hypothetical protein